MIRRLVFLAGFAIPLLAANVGDLHVNIRGKQQTIAYLPAPSSSKTAILFLPGDGGWRGLAVTVGQAVAAWGYDVFGFNTKDYLESFSDKGATLTESQMKSDMDLVTASILARGAEHVILLGWSQGAGMAALAASNPPARGTSGVIELGLPESAVLGWTWKDAVAVLGRLEPSEPHFAVKPVLGRITGVPICLIHGTNDEYTSPAKVRELYSAIAGAKQMAEIPGANHRFDGHRDELYGQLRKALDWINGAGR